MATGTVAVVLTAVLGALGVGALILAITYFGDWRSSQTDVGLLTNSTPPVDYVTGMVVSALVAFVFLGSAVGLWTWHRRRHRRKVS